MLTIRLTRKGKKNQPFFRMIVIDKRRSSKGGRTVEDLGYVDPLTKRKSFKKERVLYWISKGAKPSPRIHNLLVSEKIIDAKKIHVSKISKKKQAEISAANPVRKTEQSGLADSSEQNKDKNDSNLSSAEISQKEISADGLSNGAKKAATPAPEVKPVEPGPTEAQADPVAAPAPAVQTEPEKAEEPQKEEAPKIEAPAQPENPPAA